MFKGVLIDVDETVFDYNDTHEISLKKVYDVFFSYWTYNFFIDKWKNSVENVKSRINTHNKLFYFQDMCEVNKEFFKYKSDFLSIYKIYKQTFLDNLKLKNGIKELLEYFFKNEIKICFVTNYNSFEQLEKLNKYFSELSFYFVSSEEVGVDKPHPFIYDYSLNKLNLTNSEIIFIGNDFKDDVLGPNKKNIFSCFYNEKSNSYSFHPNYFKYSSHYQLLNMLELMNDNLKKFINISKYYGLNENYIQGGGGNISVKFSVNKYQELIIVKASGFNLSEITINKGYCIFIRNIIINELSDKMRENLNEELNDSIIDQIYLNSRTWIKNNCNPSIETLLHVVMKKKIVIHYHNLNDLCSEKEYKENKKLIDYVTPGFPIIVELIKNNLLDEDNILLKNHGCIEQTDNYEYKIVSENKINQIILNHNYKINKEKFIEVYPCTPDMALYCGKTIYFCDSISEIDNNFILEKKIKIIFMKDSIMYLCDNINEYRNMKIIFEQFIELNEKLFDSGVRKLKEEEIDKLFSWSREIKRLNVR